MFELGQIYPHGTSMQCPHCLIKFHDDVTRIAIGDDSEGQWVIEIRKCPECRKNIYGLICAERFFGGAQGTRDFKEEEVQKRYLVWPKATTRQPLPKDVPPNIVAMCCHWSNLQVLTPSANRIKNGKFDKLELRCFKNFWRANFKPRRKQLTLFEDSRRRPDCPF